ncbi:MAG: hypothetical protein M1819_001353 [Sarea resinae]|nr:MAG: hypothetical protein M1819_001353 [Sarea resinae]
MFDLFAQLLSSILTILFPIFASYKALRTSDPAQLTPWLMYWVVLSCALLVESWTEWILVWLPFYPWIRLFLHTYLMLPQTQGAHYLYTTHVHPFLSQHESEIDNFITNAHDRAKAAGVQYLKQAIDFLKEHLLGITPSKAATTRPASASSQSYAQSLFARFNLPRAREGFAAPAGDFYGLLSSAVVGAMSRTGADPQSTAQAQADEMSASGTLIPAGLDTAEERMSFISTQRERLRVLLTALDNEARNLDSSPSSASTSRPATSASATAPRSLTPASAASHDGAEYDGDALRKTRSELEFERISHADAPPTPAAAPAKGGWMPWNWGSASAASPDAKTKGDGEVTPTSATEPSGAGAATAAEQVQDEKSTAFSSAVDEE